MSWLKYAGKRLLMLIPVIICVTFVLFLILSAAPGDLARSLLGDDATPEQIAEKKAEMGLDQPLLGIVVGRPDMGFLDGTGSGSRYQDDMADAGRRQVEGERAAQATGADKQDRGGEQLLLCWYSELGEREVAGVALALGGGQRHGGREHCEASR